MNKYFFGLFVAVGLMAGAIFAPREASASVVARSPKATAAINYTTAVSTISAIAGAVYQVIIATGAAGDYCVLFDSANGQNYASTSQAATPLKARLYASSTTASTVVTFDPPLQFFNGIMAAVSAAGDQCLIVYESGRGLSGQ